MELEVRVDRQGRLVIPAPVRRMLGLSGGGKLLLRVKDGRVELIPDDEVARAIREDREGR